MSDDDRLASVIVPMRNAEAYVGEALRSVLEQKDVALEVVVVDDGSTDGSVAVVEAIGDPRVRVIAGPCRGVAAAMNVGMSETRGEIILRCDADDIYPPDRIARQRRLLDELPEFGAVCGAFAAFDDKGAEVDLNCGGTSMEITEELRTGNSRTSFCTFAVRRACMTEMGGYREYFQTASDVDAQLRLGEVCRVWYDARVVYRYRLHETSITHRQPTPRREFFDRILREFSEERRTSGADALMRGTPPEPPASDSRPSAASDQMGGMLRGESWRLHRSGQKLAAIRVGIQACLRQPARWAAWRNIVVLLAKSAIPAVKVGDK